MKERGGGHKTFGLSKTYPVFLVEKKPKTLSSIIIRSSFTFLFRKNHPLLTSLVYGILAEVLVLNPHRCHQKKMNKNKKKIVMY